MHYVDIFLSAAG